MRAVDGNLPDLDPARIYWIEVKWCCYANMGWRVQRRSRLWLDTFILNATWQRL